MFTDSPKTSFVLLYIVFVEGQFSKERVQKNFQARPAFICDD